MAQNNRTDADAVLHDLATLPQGRIENGTVPIVMQNSLELQVDKLLWLLFEGHALRVMELTSAVLKAIGITDPTTLRNARHGALVHDIGKIGVPDRIILKPAKLNPIEWQLMRQHCRWGHNICLTNEELHDCWAIPYCHHERWDGSGYPQGLEATEIPIEARAFAPIDVFDALIEDRPYRDALAKEDAWAILEEGRGKHFDPTCLDAFRDVWAKGRRAGLDDRGEVPHV